MKDIRQRRRQLALLGVDAPNRTHQCAAIRGKMLGEGWRALIHQDEIARGEYLRLDADAYHPPSTPT